MSPSNPEKENKKDIRKVFETGLITKRKKFRSWVMI